MHASIDQEDSMTADPDSDSDRPGNNPASAGGLDVAHPLSAYVHGLLTVHFGGGAIVKHRMSQLDARAFLAKQTDDEHSDEITWESRSWFTWARDRVVFASFSADRDQNWPITPEDRRRLTKAGHPHGVIASLVSLWGESGRCAEPGYSIRSIVTLHQTARDGADRTIWEAAARTCAGTRGAAILASLLRDDEPQSAPSEEQDGEGPGVDLRADDEAEPDDAAEAAPGGRTADSQEEATDPGPSDSASPQSRDAE
jgi:hypothetical protein